MSQQWNVIGFSAMSCVSTVTDCFVLFSRRSGRRWSICLRFWHIWNLIAALVIVFGRFVSLFTCRFCTVVSCQAGRCIHQIVIMGMSWNNVNNGSLLLKVLSGLKSFVVCFQRSFVAGLLWAPSWSQPVFARFCSKISLLFHGQIFIFNVPDRNCLVAAVA